MSFRSRAVAEHKASVPPLPPAQVRRKLDQTEPAQSRPEGSSALEVATREVATDDASAATAEVGTHFHADEPQHLLGGEQQPAGEPTISASVRYHFEPLTSFLEQGQQHPRFLHTERSVDGFRASASSHRLYFCRLRLASPLGARLAPYLGHKNIVPVSFLLTCLLRSGRPCQQRRRTTTRERMPSTTFPNSRTASQRWLLCPSSPSLKEAPLLVRSALHHLFLAARRLRWQYVFPHLRCASSPDADLMRGLRPGAAG